MREDYHLVGIGGIGMSGLARILLQRKAQVSGSDLAPTPVTRALKTQGAKLYYGHAESYVKAHKTVVYTSDVNQENPEVSEAKRLNCRLLHRSQLLADLMVGSKPLAVTGTHGKTTTSALLTWVLAEAGLDPSYAVGGVINRLDVNAAHGPGEYFVAEADESDGSFLAYHPYGAIITNIDLDHLSYYGSEEGLVRAFETFANKANLLFWCGDDVRLRRLRLKGISYGFGAECQWRAVNYHQQGWTVTFDACFDGHTYPAVEVALIGSHNACNALAVFALALQLGVPEEAIRSGLRTFPGVRRRCECKGDSHGVLVLDDYAHHPAEIRATLKGIRSAIGPRRLIAVYQPHRYSRTLECQGTYQGAFEYADELVITDIYSAREAFIPGVTHDLVLNEVQADVSIPCRYVPFSQLKKELVSHVRPHDVVVTLGAGDITQVAAALATHLRRRAPKKLNVGYVCGGMSTEHAVTLLSSRQVLPQLNREFYSVKQFGITKQGNWITGDDVVEQLQQGMKPEVRLSSAILKQLLACDVIIPMIHGTPGEDGVAQGFFEFLGKAYVGCDLRSSAIAMDKALTKNLCATHEIATAPFVAFSCYQWETERDSLLDSIQRFSWPVWVKPTHLGSSVEVHRVESDKALCEALDRIFRVDTHALVEPEISGRELEVAVFGDDELVAFPPGEVFTGQRVYDYEGKYGSGGTPTTTKADVPAHVAAAGMEIAKKVYRMAGCSGLARIDFFLDDQERYWLIEINPMPGFTRNSLYPLICRANGLEIGRLFDELLVLAMQRRRRQDRLKV